MKIRSSARKLALAFAVTSFTVLAVFSRPAEAATYQWDLSNNSSGWGLELRFNNDQAPLELIVQYSFAGVTLEFDDIANTVRLFGAANGTIVNPEDIGLTGLNEADADLFAGTAELDFTYRQNVTSGPIGSDGLPTSVTVSPASPLNSGTINHGAVGDFQLALSFLFDRIAPEPGYSFQVSQGAGFGWLFGTADIANTLGQPMTVLADRVFGDWDFNAEIPEPATAVLVGSALLLGARRRRQRS